MKTIGRNRRKLIDSIFYSAKRARVYSLENGFVGEPVPVLVARNAYKQYEFAKLRDYGHRYVVSVHSNLWYELYTEGEQTAAAEEVR